MTLSQVRPKRRPSQPMPPPSVSPATPVWDTVPAGVASPNAWASRSYCAERNPGLHAGAPGDGIDAHAAHGRQVDHEPAVADRLAGEAVATAANRDQQVVGPREAHRRPRRRRRRRSGRSAPGGGRRCHSRGGARRRSRRCRRAAAGRAGRRASSFTLAPGSTMARPAPVTAARSCGAGPAISPAAASRRGVGSDECRRASPARTYRKFVFSR